MVPFTLFEGIFFMSVGIVFFLGGALFYFFKKRIETLEKSNETLGNICKTMVSELENFKRINDNETMPKYNTNNTSYFPSKLNVIDEVINEIESDTDNESNDGDSDDNSSDTTTILSETHNEIDIDLDLDNETNIVDLDNETNIVDLDNENKEQNIDVIVDNNINETNLEKNNEMTFHEEIIAIEDDLEEDNISERLEEEIGSQISKYTQNNLQKMNVAMLKTIIVQNNINHDISNMKKKELINVILNN